jgi:hypothetical protein
VRPEPLALGTIVLLPATVLLWGSAWDVGCHFDHRWLLLVWVVWGLVHWPLRGGGRADDAPVGSIAARMHRVLALWRKIDAPAAALLVYAVLFQVPDSVALPLAVIAVLAGAIFLVDRSSGPVLLALVVATLVFGVALPFTLRTALISRIAAIHRLDVDHRLVPDGGEINTDSARFRGEAGDLSEDDFVVLFMGDSFTFGFNLPYEQAYPHQLERIAAAHGCGPRLRVVNFGWTSASPLLALRLLRQVGHAYHPDLVIHSLDMTDFHDDLRYEVQLREQRDFDVDTAAVLRRALETSPALAGVAGPIVGVIDALPRRRRSGDRERLLADLEVPGPTDRYFATNHPLEVSRPAIEAGVMKNLAEMDGLVRDVLGAEFSVVVYPRAYQFSRRESPNNWEASAYTVLGPYVGEPFRYFDEVGPSLPYPVISLMPTFAGSAEFPLFFGNDPHWNARGARLAAQAVLREHAALGLITCQGDVAGIGPGSLQSE